MNEWMNDIQWINEKIICKNLEDKYDTRKYKSIF